VNARGAAIGGRARELFRRALAAIAWFVVAGAAAAGPLDATLAGLKRGEWASYEVAMIEGKGSPCCFEWRDDRLVDQRCKLDSRNWSFGTDDQRPATSDTLRVYLRRGDTGLDRVRALGADCPVDRGALTVHALGPVEAAQSLAALERTLDTLAKGDRANVHAAIALHAEPKATALLARLANPPGAGEDRRDASFWLAQARGIDGYRAVRDLLGRERDGELRRHLVFALSQSPVAEAAVELRRLAREHEDPELRGEALFWLVQIKDAQAEALALHAVDHERSREVGKKAIFALSQLPPKRAIAALRGIVQSQRPRALRREALFWLGQIDDDEALAVFDELLGAPR
jgi:hypothetical protein